MSTKILLDRFWSKVNKTESCWNWTGGISHGYGIFSVKSRNHTFEHLKNVFQVKAHRFSYEIHHNISIPPDRVIDHLCRNKKCVNPNHLELVTIKINTMRGLAPSARFAKASHCIHGHEFDEKNTYIKPNGARRCRKCAYIRERKYKGYQDRSDPNYVSPKRKTREQDPIIFNKKNKPDHLCIRGHLLEKQNLIPRKNRKKFSCRKCTIISSRISKDRIKAHKAALSLTQLPSQ